MSEADDATALPKGWTREFSRSQKREYFYHAESKRSVWTREELKAAAAEDSSSPKDDEAARKRPRARSDGGEPSKRQRAGRRVAIIVPFRDLHEKQQRSKHLAEFVPHMTRFLDKAEGVEAFHVLVVEQSKDGRKFNRGKLLNIGFKHAVEAMADMDFDSFVFHDVDLLPQEPLAPWYAKYPAKPIHIARCWGRYNDSAKYFGGIVAFSKSDYEKVDGFPNTYWGWGGEDDELLNRVSDAGLEIDAPPKDLPGAVVDLEHMDLKTKLNLLRKTDWKCNVKWEARDEYNNYRPQRTEIPWWGLRGTRYDVLETQKLGEHATRLTVDVQFNFNSDGSRHWANDKTDWN